MSMNQYTPPKLIDNSITPTLVNDPLCSCGCKRFDHRKGAKAYGACRMCLPCRKFKIPKPIKSKKKNT